VLGGQVVGFAARVLHQSPHAVEPLRWGMLTLVIVGLLGALPLPWLQARPRQHGPKAERPPYDLRLYARLLVPDVLLTCGGGAVAGFIGLYLTLRFGMRPDSLGTFLAVSGVIGGVLVLLAPRVADKLGTARAAVTLQAAGVPAVVVLSLAPTQGLAMGAEVLRNAFRSMADPVYDAFAMSAVPAEQRATISGLYSATWSIGFSIGPAISGVVQQQVGFAAAFLFGAALMTLGATLLWAFFLRGRTERAADWQENPLYEKPEGTR
jgi:predicted MFS family arabinose efflux permease